MVISPDVVLPKSVASSIKNTAAFAVVADVPAISPALSYMITRFLVADALVDRLARAVLPSSSAVSKEVPANRIPVISNIPDVLAEKSKSVEIVEKTVDSLLLLFAAVDLSR